MFHLLHLIRQWQAWTATFNVKPNSIHCQMEIESGHLESIRGYLPRNKCKQQWEMTANGLRRPICFIVKKQFAMIYYKVCLQWGFLFSDLAGFRDQAADVPNPAFAPHYRLGQQHIRPSNVEPCVKYWRNRFTN